MKLMSNPSTEFIGCFHVFHPLRHFLICFYQTSNHNNYSIIRCLLYLWWVRCQNSQLGNNSSIPDHRSRLFAGHPWPQNAEETSRGSHGRRGRSHGGANARCVFEGLPMREIWGAAHFLDFSPLILSLDWLFFIFFIHVSFKRDDFTFPVSFWHLVQSPVRSPKTLQKEQVVDWYDTVSPHH